jgi:hypothetical protein
VRLACVLFGVLGTRWCLCPGRMLCTGLCVWLFLWVGICPIRFLWVRLLRSPVVAFVWLVVHRRGLVGRGVVAVAVVVFVHVVIVVAVVVVEVERVAAACRFVCASLHVGVV